VIGDVRGLGLMIGVEFRGAERKPDKTTTKAVAAACLKRRLMLLTCGSFDNVVRWIPPLVVSEAQINESLDIFAQALQEVAG
jgi:4-aminobutyrate aminotransferase